MKDVLVNERDKYCKIILEITVRAVYHLPKISGLSRRARLDSSYNTKPVRTQETCKW